MMAAREASPSDRFRTSTRTAGGRGSTAGALLFEAGLEGPDLLLQPLNADLQFEQLGAESHLVQPLLYTVEPLLHSLQARNQHVVLGFKPVHTLCESIEQRVHLVPETLLGLSDDPFNVGTQHALMERAEDLRESLHGRYRTPATATPRSQNLEGAGVLHKAFASAA